MFYGRLVPRQSDRNVTRQEAKAAIGFPFCGSSLFYVHHCCSSSLAWCFHEYFFFASKYQITCLRSYYSPFHFSGVILFPFQLREKRGSSFFSDRKVHRGKRRRVDLGHRFWIIVPIESFVYEGWNGFWRRKSDLSTLLKGQSTRGSFTRKKSLKILYKL